MPAELSRHPRHPFLSSSYTSFDHAQSSDLHDHVSETVNVARPSITHRRLLQVQFRMLIPQNRLKNALCRSFTSVGYCHHCFPQRPSGFAVWCSFCRSDFHARFHGYLLQYGLPCFREVLFLLARLHRYPHVGLRCRHLGD